MVHLCEFLSFVPKKYDLPAKNQNFKGRKYFTTSFVLFIFHLRKNILSPVFTTIIFLLFLVFIFLSSLLSKHCVCLIAFNANLLNYSRGENYKINYFGSVEINVFFFSEWAFYCYLVVIFFSFFFLSLLLFLFTIFIFDNFNATFAFIHLYE